ncbi:MAG: glycosyltransferase family 4 protein [Anaerolineales bacterium]|nr:glycosyltransferase family 4 protein [Anaerolineales bacterium]
MNSKQHYCLIHIGTFPPPVTGMSVTNQALFERLNREGISVEKLDTSPGTLRRDFISRSARLPRLLRAWLRILRANPRREVLYIALSGGWGQIYDIVSLALARLKGLPRFLHHHSFAYLLNKPLYTSLLMKVAGQNALHVVLCDEMGGYLRARYGVKRVSTISNLTFFPPITQKRCPKDLQTIGFLSNITQEKGGDAVIALAYALRKKGLPLKVRLAGPCQDAALVQDLHRAVSDGVLEWSGAVYGEDKAKFWQEIDVFVFPTRYPNEAEPLVVWEALAAGVPVIAVQRGCICNQVGAAGVLIPPHEDFVAQALPIFESWLKDVDLFQSYVQQTQQRYAAMQADALAQWQKFLQNFAADHP